MPTISTGVISVRYEQVRLGKAPLDLDFSGTALIRETIFTGSVMQYVLEPQGFAVVPYPVRPVELGRLNRVSVDDPNVASGETVIPESKETIVTSGESKFPVVLDRVSCERSPSAAARDKNYTQPNENRGTWPRFHFPVSRAIEIAVGSWAFLLRHI